jgi:hypothetical protein
VHIREPSAAHTKYAAFIQFLQASLRLKFGNCIASFLIQETPYLWYKHNPVPITQRSRVLPSCSLREEQDGTWTLLYEGAEYIRLLDARSFSDAEQQIAEMLLQGLEVRLTTDDQGNGKHP